MEIKSPARIKDIQCLTERIAALNQFISRAMDKSLPFFKALKRGAEFAWTDGCERSFQELKRYFGKALVLSKPLQGKTLVIYLAVFEATMSTILIRMEANVELPVFYVSRTLLDPEISYPDTEKIALALIVATRKLRLYF